MAGHWKHDCETVNVTQDVCDVEEKPAQISHFMNCVGGKEGLRRVESVGRDSTGVESRPSGA